MPDTPFFFSTRDQARRFEMQAARGLASGARDTKRELQTAVNDMVRALNALREVGICRNFLDDTIGGLCDEADFIDAACLKNIDNAGEHADAVDLAEARALLAKVRA